MRAGRASTVQRWGPEVSRGADVREILGLQLACSAFRRARRAAMATGLVAAAMLIGAGAVFAAPGPAASTQPALLAVPPDLPDCTEPAPFPDVPITHPFCPEIKWMKDNGISTGFDDGTYRPSINVSR